MHGNTLIIDAFWVDNKPFPTAQATNFGDGRAFHDYYNGTARYLGWMDLVLLKDIIKRHNISDIILQNLDVFGKIAHETKEIKVCMSYEYKNLVFKSFDQNKLISQYHLSPQSLIHCKPIYQSVEFGGWDLSEDDFEVPSRAKLYMKFLLVHTRVNSITYMNNKIKLTAHFDFLGNVVFKTESEE